MRQTWKNTLSVLTLISTIVDANAVPEGVVKLDARHRHIPRHVSKKAKRDTTVLADLKLNDQWVVEGSYFIDVEVGTPPQKFELLLDTGSANFYLPKSTAATCQRYLCPGGSYITEDSSTYAKVSTPLPLRLSYVDTSTVNGTYASDTVTVAGAELDKFVFAVANELQVSPGMMDGPQYGIMGISYLAAESSLCASAYYNGSSCAVNFTTPTIPGALYDDGYIKSRSYSLYLDDPAARAGSILFGGIDTAKFTGDLVTLGVPTDTRNEWSYGLWTYQDLYLTSVSGKMNGTTTKLTPSNYSSTVILDSGNPGIGLPPSIFNQIIGSLPVQERSTGYYILCKDADEIDASLIVGMSGTNGNSINIEVPFANFAITQYKGDYNSTDPVQRGGDDVCVIAIYPDAKQYSSFGDPFMRSVYAFHDLDAHTLSLAQASYDTTGSSITPVGSSGAPSSTGTGKSGPPSGPSEGGASPSGSAAVPIRNDLKLASTGFVLAAVIGYLW